VEFGEFHVHEFRAYHWSVEVEILQINGAVVCTLCGDDAVEMNLDCDHINNGGTAIPGIGDAIAADSEASAIGISLLRTIVDAHVPVCDVFVLVNWDVDSSNEDDCVGALAKALDTLGKATKFDHVGLSPEFFVLGVDEKVAHFHEGSSVGVEDNIENFARELPTRGLMHREWVARDVVVNMDARKEGLLSDGPYLCAALCVAHRGVIVDRVSNGGYLL
jgi:hypothetical protein